MKMNMRDMKQKKQKKGEKGKKKKMMMDMLMDMMLLFVIVFAWVDNSCWSYRYRMDSRRGEQWAHTSCCYYYQC